MLYYFIVNPKSGSSPDIGGICRLRDYLRGRGGKVFVSLTSSLSHAGELAVDAVRLIGSESGGDGVIVVAGGDGTVRTVINAMAGADVPILIVPCGTENLLACEVGLDGKVETSIAALEHGVVRELDLGNVNDKHFMAIVGVGFDADVVRRVHGGRVGHITACSYIWPICRTFWEYRFEPVRVEADGELVCDAPALVFVSNISRYAVGLGISPDADLGDGLLDLCIMRCDNHLQLLSHSINTVLRRPDKTGRISRQRCRKVTISSSCGDIATQFDGDPGPGLPLNIEVQPAAAKILTPPAHGPSEYHSPVRFYHLKRWLLR